MTNVWAFNWVTDDDARRKVYESALAGRSRFGWSQSDENDLRKEENRTPDNGRQMFLPEIRPGDWIVHINTPEWGRCVAARVTAEYDFDDGLRTDWGRDFSHVIGTDPDSVREFSRYDPAIEPTVNLRPRRRYQRIYEVEAFKRSIDRLREGDTSPRDGEGPEERHLKDRTERQLAELTEAIHAMHRGKALEGFMADVFRRIPGVANVKENGSPGWRSDHGADLIIDMVSRMGTLEFEQRIVVQVKSYAGPHEQLDAVDQVRTGIQQYDGSAGLIVTTGERTEALEERIADLSQDIDRPIELLAGDEVAKFVLRHAPEKLFRF